jgi:hypothetical protein
MPKKDKDKIQFHKAEKELMEQPAKDKARVI